MKADQRDRMVDALRERGVTYLAGGRGEPSGLSDAEVINALVQSDDARLRLALTPLFLSQPSLAEVVPIIVKQFAPATARALQQRYTAAVCLQRFWRSRLHNAIGLEYLLPDWFSAALGLPTLEIQHGKWALWRLAEQMSVAHDGIDFWASFHKTFEHFVQQRELELVYEPA